MTDVAFYNGVLNVVQFTALDTVPDLPPTAWWLPLIVIFILGVAAVIDAVTGIIPDWLIFFGLAAVTITDGVTMDWPFAAAHLRIGIAVCLGLWFINRVWRMKFDGDAFGMGDAKWTMLAVACFGFMPALFAWGVGACLAVVWIGGSYALRRRMAHVYFGPFLFAGLLIALYWLRVR